MDNGVEANLKERELQFWQNLPTKTFLLGRIVKIENEVNLITQLIALRKGDHYYLIQDLKLYALLKKDECHDGKVGCYVKGYFTGMKHQGCYTMKIVPEWEDLNNEKFGIITEEELSSFYKFLTKNGANDSHICAFENKLTGNKNGHHQIKGEEMDNLDNLMRTSPVIDVSRTVNHRSSSYQELKEDGQLKNTSEREMKENGRDLEKMEIVEARQSDTKQDFKESADFQIVDMNRKLDKCNKEEGDKNSADFWFWEARKDYNEGHIDMALMSIEKCLGIDPDHLYALLDRATISYRLGKRDDAVADLKRCLEINPTSETAKKYAREIMSTEAAGSIEIESNADKSNEGENDKNCVNYWIQKARQDYTEGNTRKALLSIKKCLSIDPNNLAALLDRVSIFYHLGKNNLAVADTKRCLLIDPNNADVQEYAQAVLSTKAKVCEQEKRFMAAARTYYEIKSILKDPTANQKCLRNIAKHLLETYMENPVGPYMETPTRIEDPDSDPEEEMDLLYKKYEAEQRAKEERENSMEEGEIVEEEDEADVLNVPSKEKSNRRSQRKRSHSPNHPQRTSEGSQCSSIFDFIYDSLRSTTSPRLDSCSTLINSLPKRKPRSTLTVALRDITDAYKKGNYDALKPSRI